MNVLEKRIIIYERSDGVLPFVEWIRNLRDIRGKQKVEARIDRVRLGNMGDHRSVGEGVQEMRIHYGPGYRVYLGEEGNTFVILLSGGDKGSQDEDIKKAKEYWKDYKEEKERAGN